MKRTFLLFVVAIFSVIGVSAQDLIVKIDSSRIEAQVTEISPETVRYKRFSNLNGPTYVLPVSAIEMIRFANGEVEYFHKDSAPATPAAEPVHPAAPDQPATPDRPTVPAQPAAPEQPVQPAAPATAAPAATTPSTSTPGVIYEARKFEIGDYYDYNGIKGVVCALSDNHLHGLVISLDEVYLHWDEYRKPDLRKTGIAHNSDGEANMKAVEEYIAANGLTWDHFPAFKWCKDHGEGWYLPSIDELLLISHNYNGGNRVQFDRHTRNKFNQSLKDNGGERMDRMVYYFSSTEKDEKEALTVHMGLEPPYVIPIPKYNKFLVRAVHKF